MPRRPRPVPDSGVASVKRDGANAELARYCKALGHPVRVRILRHLLGRATCMYGDLAEEIPLAQSTVSQHLAVLKEAGLVRGEFEGPRVCYCADREAVGRLLGLLGSL
jgi:ArsR family transcriptional regulator